MTIKQLDSENLTHRCDPEQFDFRSTAELEDLTDVIGQPRAVNAVKFGMGIRHKGYNLFALGPTGTGKHELVRRHATEQAASEPVPPDRCYINNFKQPSKPRMLSLPPGRGVELENSMQQLIEDLHATIPTVFESEEYQTRKHEIEEELSERKEQALKAIQENAEKKKIALIRTPTGFTLAPLHEGEIISPEEFEKLSTEKRERIEKDTGELWDQLRKMLREVPKWQKEARDRIGKLNREMTASAISHLIDELRDTYRDLQEVIGFLGEVEQDVIENFRRFLHDEDRHQGAALPGIQLQRHGEGLGADNRYRVNTLVTHEN
ncbi:MAG: ATP-binding protein, partial [Gammaproteobacteria bacterium]